MSNLNTRSTSGIRKIRELGHDDVDQVRSRKKSKKEKKVSQTLDILSNSGSDSDIKISISKSLDSSRNVDNSSHKKSSDDEVTKSVKFKVWAGAKQPKVYFTSKGRLLHSNLRRRKMNTLQWQLHFVSMI